MIDDPMNQQDNFNQMQNEIKLTENTNGMSLNNEANQASVQMDQNIDIYGNETDFSQEISGYHENQDMASTNLSADLPNFNKESGLPEIVLPQDSSNISLEELESKLPQDINFNAEEHNTTQEDNILAMQNLNSAVVQEIQTNNVVEPIASYELNNSQQTLQSELYSQQQPIQNEIVSQQQQPLENYTNNIQQQPMSISETQTSNKMMMQSQMDNNITESMEMGLQMQSPPVQEQNISPEVLSPDTKINTQMLASAIDDVILYLNSHKSEIISHMNPNNNG